LRTRSISKSMGINTSTTTAPSTNDTNEKPLLQKVVVIGSKRVGKSSLVSRFGKDELLKEHKETIGIDFTIKTKEIDGKMVKFQ
jgi:GTPase SAR1 family protein